MSWIRDNIEKYIIGLEGEEIVRNWFKKNKIPYMQVDIMWKHEGKWFLGEIKSQEKYLAPPFDGHGLPPWQIERRIQFYEDTGVEPWLIVYDLIDKCVYMQSIVTLMKTEHYKTKGKSPRVIFKLDSFKKIEI